MEDSSYGNDVIITLKIVKTLVFLIFLVMFCGASISECRGSHENEIGEVETIIQAEEEIIEETPACTTHIVIAIIMITMSIVLLIKTSELVVLVSCLLSLVIMIFFHHCESDGFVFITQLFLGSSLPLINKIFKSDYLLDLFR